MRLSEEVDRGEDVLPVLLDGRDAEDVAVSLEDLLRDTAPEDPAGLEVLPDFGQADREDERACVGERSGEGLALLGWHPFCDLARLEPVVSEDAPGLGPRHPARAHD